MNLNLMSTDGTASQSGGVPMSLAFSFNNVRANMEEGPGEASHIEVHGNSSFKGCVTSLTYRRGWEGICQSTTRQGMVQNGQSTSLGASRDLELGISLPVPEPYRLIALQDESQTSSAAALCPYGSVHTTTRGLLFLCSCGLVVDHGCAQTPATVPSPNV